MGSLCQLVVLSFMLLFVQTESKGLTLIQVLKLADLDDAETADISRILEGLTLNHGSLESDVIDLGEIDPSQLVTSCIHGKCEYCINALVLKACVVVEMLAEQIGFRVALEINGITLIEKTITVSNPPSFCINEIPFLSWIGDLCLEVYDVNIKEKSACVRVSFVFRLFHKKFSFKIKCFKLPFEEADVQMIGGNYSEPEAAVDLTTIGRVLSKSSLDLAPSDLDDLLKDCSKGTCKFCVKNGFEACMQVDELSSKIGFHISMTLERHVIMKQEITVSNPKPFCLQNTPVIKQITDLCLSLEKINMKQLSACAKLSFSHSLGPLPPRKMKFEQCFTIPNGAETDHMIRYTVYETDDIQHDAVNEAETEDVQKEAQDVLDVQKEAQDVLDVQKEANDVLDVQKETHDVLDVQKEAQDVLKFISNKRI